MGVRQGFRIWDEDADGWEAYIPLARTKRERSAALFAEIEANPDAFLMLGPIDGDPDDDGA